MNRIKCLIPLLLVAGSLTAQAPADSDGGPHLSFGLNTPQGNALTMTRQQWKGQTVELGWRFLAPDYGVSFQPYVGWGKMPGKQNIVGRDTSSYWAPNTYDLTNWRVGLDIRFHPFDSLPLFVATGPSFHTWQVEQVGRLGDQSLGQAGVRLGWRLGVDYAIADRWSVGLWWTQSEWNSQRDVSQFPGYQSDNVTPSYIDGLNPSRPAYFSLMATYRF